MQVYDGKDCVWKGQVLSKSCGPPIFRNKQKKRPSKENEGVDTETKDKHNTVVD